MHANECNNCQHCWQLSKKTKHSGIVILRKDCNAHAQTFSRGQHCCGSMHCCGSTLCWSQNNRNVGTCSAKSFTSFKLYATSTNKCQHSCGAMQTDATSHNIVGPNIVACCQPTMLRLFAWACKFDQFQIIRNKCQHCCGSMQMDATCWAQQCCMLLTNSVGPMQTDATLLAVGTDSPAFLMKVVQSI